MNGENTMRNRKIPGRESGFTLIELLITLVIAGVMSAAMFSFYQQNLRTDSAQSTVVRAQQNLRASLGLMIRELRMSGYDPTKAGFTGMSSVASSGLTIRMDLDGNGNDLGPDERIAYGFDAADDPDGDGIAGNDAQEALGFAADLVRRTWDQGAAAWGAWVAVAEDIQAIEFYYTLANGTQTLTPATPADIRIVEVSVLARASSVDQDHTDSGTYATASGAVWGPYNDGYRRRFMTVKTILRNMSRSLSL